MRNAFARCITQMAEQDEKVILLYADIGNRLFNPLKQVAAKRCVNTGIAEAHMASMAAGLAKRGMRPFIYSIASFTTARNYEQIKIDIAYQNLPVVIVGTGAGLSYGNLGPTHHALDDIAMMRALPNMSVFCPVDGEELAQLLPQIMQHDGPAYVRIGKKNEPLLSTMLPTRDEPPYPEITKPRLLRQGQDFLIISCGVFSSHALELANQLSSKLGLEAGVLHLHSLKPLNMAECRRCLSQYKVVVSLEEHWNEGALGSLLASLIVEERLSLRLFRFCVPDRFIDKVSSRNSALKAAGLSVEHLLERIEQSVLPLLAGSRQSDGRYQ
ncbi:MAG: transketolase [Phototrophicales bacterium]|nr:MAG: transketolase [Phototrophicales bacterium]